MDEGHKWERARELFLDLADVSADQRERELDDLGREDVELSQWVRQLLDHDPGLESSSAGEGPRRFGPYEVIRPIGAGGMGEVFVARRADGAYESEVAIKLLRSSMPSQELVQRFLRERQTLAQLNHEYITRLLDGGTTDAGEPYLVMEFVEGEPADNAAARLPLRERIELFLRIGQAVSHAHERGFVHRDLKPSNILVRADGTPRLLDFGIARPDGERPPDTPDGQPLTQTGARLFTPEYASPEQLRGETATPKSDIFALGVLLYVFLAGKRPWTSTSGQLALELEICDDDPLPPSRLTTGTSRARVAGDLDAVVMQCLSKRPERRYPSVAELCEDLERHLAGHPIRARRTGTFGRAIRFIRRRPVLSLSALLVLIAGIAGGATWMANRSEQRRQNDLVASISNSIGTARFLRTSGDLPAAIARLDQALESMEGLDGFGALKAEVLAQRAIFANFSRDNASAMELLERARDLLARNLEGLDPHIPAQVLNARAIALRSLDRGAASLGAAVSAAEYAKKNLIEGEVLWVDAHLGLANEYLFAGREVEALDVHAQAIERCREYNPDSETLTRALNDAAVTLAGLGRFEDSVEHYREALDILSWHRGSGHPSLAKVRINLGAALFRLGRLDESRSAYELTLTAAREQQANRLIAGSLHFLGRIHYEQDRLAQAEQCALEAIEIREREGLPGHAKRSACLLGIIQAKGSRMEEAHEVLRPILESLAPGDLLPDMEADACHYLGAILQERGESHVAEPHLARALELKQPVLGAENEEVQDLVRRLARTE